ncbi:MAG: GntR family transcriptional regulator [Pseudomonadota bacterium]
MNVDRHANDTPWFNVYRDLRRQIDSGVLVPGDQLPTLASLARQRRLTNHGARRVMERLRDEGRVESWQGLGYRVSLQRVAYRISKNPSFSDTVRRNSRQGDTTVIGRRAVPLPHELSNDMGLRTGSLVFRTELLRSIDGVPMVIARNHFPLPRFEGIADALEATGSVSKALAVKGVPRYERRSTRIEARLPTAQEHLLLNIPRSQPVVVTIGTNVDDVGETVEVSQAVSRADCVSFEV